MAMPQSHRPHVGKTKFTPVDAARLAFGAHGVMPCASDRRNRLLLGAAVAWCRDLQFPTVRGLGRELGLSSTSSVAKGFGGLIGVQAAVIGREWQRLEDCWAVQADQRPVRLMLHAEALAAVERPCLRLPSLVWSAATTADRSRASAMPGMGAAVHVLAALVDPSCGVPSAALLHQVMELAHVAHGNSQMAVVA